MTCTAKTKQNDAQAAHPYESRKSKNACTWCQRRKIRCKPTNDSAGRCEACVKKDLPKCVPYQQKPAGRPPKVKIPTRNDTGHKARKPAAKPRRPRKVGKGASDEGAPVQHTFPSAVNTFAAPASIMAVEDAVDEDIPTPEATYNWTLPSQSQEALLGADLQAPAHPGYPLDGYSGSQHTMLPQLTGAFFPGVPLITTTAIGPYAGQSLAGAFSAFSGHAPQPLAGPSNHGLIPNVDYHHGANIWLPIRTDSTPAVRPSNFAFEGIDPGTGLGLYPMNTNLDDVTNYKPW